MTETQTNGFVEDVEFHLREADAKMCELHAWIKYLQQERACDKKECTRNLRLVGRIRSRVLRLNGLVKLLEKVPESVAKFDCKETP